MAATSKWRFRRRWPIASHQGVWLTGATLGTEPMSSATVNIMPVIMLLTAGLNPNYLLHERAELLVGSAEFRV